MKRALVLAALMLCAVAGAEVLKPTSRLSEVKPKIDLEAQVPKAFGDWRVDPFIIPIQPSPDVQARLDVLYTQVLARTYVNSRGERVMLSIAYGSDQGSEATAVHRPEFCYASQGFKVSDLGTEEVALGGRRLLVRRLLGTAGTRVEGITYWVTLDETATLPGVGRKLAQIGYGLRGQIPDGMLVRVSSIQSGDLTAAFGLQKMFIQEISVALAAIVRARYIGALL